MMDWKKVVVAPTTSLGETIAIIDASSMQIALVLGENGRLDGVVTDGDVRRAILRGVALTSPTADVMNSKPLVLPAGTAKHDVLAFMRQHAVHHVPIVDASGCLLALETVDALIGSLQYSTWVVLMAGGMGMRLRPLTETCPKPLLP